MIKSLPSLSTERRVRLEDMAGFTSAFADVPPGCRLHPGYAYAFKRCAEEVPFHKVAGDGQRVALTDLAVNIEQHGLGNVRGF